MLRYYASQSLAQQNAILRGLQERQESAKVVGNAVDNSFSTSDPLGTSVLNYITLKLNQSKQDQERRSLRTGIIHAIHNESVKHSEIHSSAAGTTLSKETSNRSLSMLLADLRYGGMNDRQERISEAHETTFQWLFEDSENDKWASFRDWLESDEKLYWITGKAGSGKSTLMKYICYPVKLEEESVAVPRCHKSLTTWSGDKHLVIASFYFWNSGIQAQMTQRGLLMSLLHQILEQCPKLGPLACPERWETLSLFGEDILPWEDRELRDVLYQATKNINQANSAIVLFVDGLDEFQGKPEELISIFRNIIDFSNVKLCVASRPWVEFHDAFQHRPSLMLENLTYDDIKMFVTSRFHNEPMFAQLCRREEEFADQLIETIVVKASGVFLWVTLVVSSLIAGMSAGDRVSDFLKRLDQLPEDLSKLYEKMLSSLDKFYLEHTAQLFSLVKTTSFPMNLVLASFVDEDDPNFAILQPHRPLSEDETVLRMDTMRRRINTRSKGLLETKGPVSTPQGFKYGRPWYYARYTVQYLHRTVKDYIESPKAQAMLKSAATSPFDPHLRLLAGHIAYIKRLDPRKIFAKDLWCQNLRECLLLARAVSPSSIPQMILLLDEMGKVGPPLFQALAASENHDIPRWCSWAWHQNWFWDLDRKGDFRGFTHSFLSVAVKFGVVEYVRARAEAGCLTELLELYASPATSETPQSREWPLLMDAVSGTARAHDSYINLNDRLSAIRCLLEKSADPNYKIHDLHLLQTSPLIESVYGLLNSISSQRTEECRFWSETTRLFAARAGTPNKQTVDSALCMYLKGNGRKWPQFSVRTFRQWSQARKAVRKALEELVRGGDPDLRGALDKVYNF